jgi:hypothetical protein
MKIFVALFAVIATVASAPQLFYGAPAFGSSALANANTFNGFNGPCYGASGSSASGYYFEINFRFLVNKNIFFFLQKRLHQFQLLEWAQQVKTNFSLLKIYLTKKSCKAASSATTYSGMMPGCMLGGTSATAGAQAGGGQVRPGGGGMTRPRPRPRPRPGTFILHYLYLS